MEHKVLKKSLADKIAEIIFDPKNNKDLSLWDEIEKTRLEMDCAMNNYNAVTNIELTDYYIYQFKAAQIKYDYLTKLARQKKIAE